MYDPRHWALGTNTDAICTISASELTDDCEQAHVPAETEGSRKNCNVKSVLAPASKLLADGGH